MHPKRKAAVFERGQQLWFSITESERTAVRVLAELRREGFSASKATVSRWAQQWRQRGGEGLECLQPYADGAVEEAGGDLSDVPDWAKEAIPEWVWPITKGTGLDRVQSAASAIASAVQAAAPRFVDALLDGDDRPLRAATGALMAAASTLEKVSRARLQASVAMRRAAERDRSRDES
jgi:hypothetical protein